MNWIPSDEEVAYYKALNQDKSDNSDYYKMMLPLLLENVNEEYNQNFDPTNLPGGIKIFLAKAVQFYANSGSGLTSRSMGSVSYSFDFSTLPSTLTDLLTKYRKVKFIAF